MENGFLCPKCGQIAVPDLSELDYGPDVQTTRCTHCGADISREYIHPYWTAWALV